MSSIYINGQFLPRNEARVHVDERGFRFGDGVFETIAVHHGMPYLWEYHLGRLQAGLAALRIEFSTVHLLKDAAMLIQKNNVDEGLFRLSISRGIGSVGYLPAPDAKATVVMQLLPPAAPLAQPLSLWLSSYEKISAQALPVGCKLTQGVNPTLARLEAQDHGCDEALQLNAQGHITEASAANIFWLKDGILHTPALSCGMLAGVTRQRIIELSPYKAVQGAYPLTTLQDADAVILTNAARGVMAVTSLQPQAYRWQSTTLAEELQALRAQDIFSYLR